MDFLLEIKVRLDFIDFSYVMGPLFSYRQEHIVAGVFLEFSMLLVQQSLMYFI